MRSTEKKFKHAGYECEVVLIDRRHRCGYVTVPRTHIAAKIGNYDDIPVDVHGGLTYAENNKKGFTVGFDCAHAGDTITIWTTEAVEKECRKLTEQLKKVTWKDAVKCKLRWMPDWFKNRVRYRE